VIPGYDDTKIRTPGLLVERMRGDSYRTQWQEAIAADPNWVLITSWNEWHEGSEIEPSLESGEQYLKQTSELSARFKSEK
jgi:glycoprotein endo-alpha-1,2-mannosidase